MSKRDYRFFLSDIKDCGYKILEYTRGKSLEDFSDNSMLFDAVIRNLEVIGEAAKNIPKGIRQKYPQIEWKKLSDMRNIIIHEYFGIDNKIVWDIIQNKLPELITKIESILQDKS